MLTACLFLFPRRYDPKNHAHVAIREGIEVGNGLPLIPGAQVVVDALRTAGFEVIERDRRHADSGAAHRLTGPADACVRVEK